MNPTKSGTHWWDTKVFDYLLLGCLAIGVLFLLVSLTRRGEGLPGALVVVLASAAAIVLRRHRRRTASARSSA